MIGQKYEADKVKDMKELVTRAAKLYPDRIAFKEITGDGIIAGYSFVRLKDDMNAFGTKLLDMGLKGNHLAVLGESSYAWVLSYLTAANGVGVVVPMDKELTNDDFVRLLCQSDADAIICSGTFTAVIAEILPQCPKIKTCILMNSKNEYPGFQTIERLVEDGRKLLEGGDVGFINAAIDAEALAAIVFTSGTTGANKGVMLSHKNAMAVAQSIVPCIKAKGVSFSVLPIHHTYEFNCHILSGLYMGFTVCFNDSLKRVMQNFNLFKPNLTIMVPMLLEAMYKNILKETEKNDLTEHLQFGIQYSNFIRKFGVDLRRVFFKPVLVKFGGNLRLIVSGGAPLHSEIADWFDSIGFEVLNGYGITECAPLVSTNTHRRKNNASVGTLVPGCEARIYEPDCNGEGEIQIKGDNVMLGYYNDEANTTKTFTEDGWLKTGDIGCFDNKNFLYIRGRIKNLIILPNGENIYPEEIEDFIMDKIKYIREVVVYSPISKTGDEISINACVYIDEDFAAVNNIRDIKEMLNKDIKKLNHCLPVYKRISNISISKAEFEKTTTKKIKRNSIIEGRIEYADAD